jgi:hypothetical protein
MGVNFDFFDERRDRELMLWKRIVLWFEEMNVMLIVKKQSRQVRYIYILSQKTAAAQDIQILQNTFWCIARHDEMRKYLLTGRKSVILVMEGGKNSW